MGLLEVQCSRMFKAPLMDSFRGILGVLVTCAKTEGGVCVSFGYLCAKTEDVCV